MFQYLFIVNIFFFFFSMWVAFTPRYRPMSWTAFWFNIGAALLNLLAVGIHFAVA